MLLTSLQQQPNSSFITMSQESYLSSAKAGATWETSSTPLDDEMVTNSQSLDNKEKELKQNLFSHREVTRLQEDQVQRVLNELMCKKAAIESDHAKVQSEYGEASRELKLLANVPRSTRVREGEIADRKKEAEDYAKQRDELINKGRREEIETSIKQLEREIEDLKADIARDNESLQYLRGRVEKQSEISMLREQTAEEVSSFRLKFEAMGFDFRQCSIDVPTADLDDKSDGRELVSAMQRLVESVETKHRKTRIELEKMDADVTSAQQILSERTALLTHSQQMMETLRRRMEVLESASGSVGIVKRVFFNNNDVIPYGTEVTKPQPLLASFEQILQQINGDLEKIETRPENTINGLLQLAKMTREQRADGTYELCPCCTRTMQGGEIDIFRETMMKLANPQSSPLVRRSRADGQNLRAQKQKLQLLKKVVSNHMDDLLDMNHSIEESNKLSASVPNLKQDVGTSQVQLNNLKDARETLMSEVEALRKLMDAANVLWQDASRISAKKVDVEEKLKDEESTTGTGSFVDTRSLATVESELFERLKKKDQVGDEICMLNKEMSDLNNEIASLTTKASNLDRRVRELEQMHAKSQEEAKRRETLAEKCSACEEEEKKLRAEMTTVQQKIDAKETEKRRLRAAIKVAEAELSHSLTTFSADFGELKSLTTQIDRYAESNQADAFGNMPSEISSLTSKVKEDEEKLRVTEPSLNSPLRQMNDEERHKKSLSANNAMPESANRISKIEEDTRLQRDREEIQRGNSGEDNLDKAERRKLEIAGFAGQRHDLLDQPCSLKRKLATTEYNEID